MTSPLLAPGEMVATIDALCASIAAIVDPEEKVRMLNVARRALHEVSPFRDEPVDLVQWVALESVQANDYNPNSVAPPEMELLRLSIAHDGYTQPIVAMQEDAAFVVVDGFHRNRVGREYPDVRARLGGYLPVVAIRASRTERSDRIASTVRHNRARGKHRVDAMSDIVIELKRRNWSDERIGKELGMDPDEVLRLCQITGIAEVFSDESFSHAWIVEQEDGIGANLSDVAPDDMAASASGRILHTWDKWECYRAGFYAERPPEGMSQEEGELMYRAFLSDAVRFGAALDAVITEWVCSCEHYLTNDRMNRIAWLGQAAAVYATGIPSVCRGGYHLLSDEQKQAADGLALEYLNRWLAANGRSPVDMAGALGRTEMELY